MCGPHHCLGRGAFASDPEILRRLLQRHQNASILEQGCAGHSPNSANRKHQITRHPWRTSPPVRPSLSFRYTQGFRPAARRRSRLALTLAEREVISRGVTARRSARSIAKLLGRSPSTVSREMSRNGGCDRYRAAVADENAWARSRRPKCCKLAINSRLRQAVAGKLRLDWSPEQIAGWPKRTHSEDEYNQVSHETIYRRLFVQARGVLKKELLCDLRSKRSMRRSRPVDPNGDRRGHMKDAVSIRQRPAAVEDRAVPGHWEGDLLSGPNNTYIATLARPIRESAVFGRIDAAAHLL